MGALLGYEPSFVDATKATLADVQAQVEALTDPWHKKILANWLEHYRGEAIGDLDLIMSTMAPDPIYRFYGARFLGIQSHGVSSDINTTAETRAMYTGAIERRTLVGPIKNPRFAFAEWGLSMEGLVSAAISGSVINLPDMLIDPARRYCLTWHLAQLHPYVRPSGLMKGEIVYMGDLTEISLIPS